jgi:F-type H+-transporting ATPase subunit delta
MAAPGVVTLRYAHAFASAAQLHGLDVNAARQQMRSFADTFDGSHDLREILENPSIPSDQKLAVVDALAARLGMMPEVRNFIAVIMDNMRLSDLNDIIAAYDQIADEGLGVADAEITTAFDLNDEDRAALEAQVTKLAGGKVRVGYKQDKALLGGAVVKIGSTVYDGSVRGQLEHLKHTLLSA